MDSLIPDHPNKSDMPFDTVKYVNEQLANFEKIWKPVYSEKYYDMVLKNFSQTLETDIAIYNKWFINFINKFKQDLNNNENYSIINVPEYGDGFDYNNEKNMKDKAYSNFCYFLLKKGYLYTTKTEEWEYVDAMDGRCRGCKTIMNITLK